MLTGKPALYAAAESDDDPFDKVIEVGDELQRELENSNEPLGNDKLGNDNLRNDNSGNDRVEPQDHHEQADKSALTAETINTENKTTAVSSRTSSDPSLGDASPSSLYNALDNYAHNSSNDTLNETLHEPLNTSSDASSDDLELATSEHSDSQMFALLDESATLFDPVSQQDDLQQIFGIGPITEKALNDLGITSYSQLAELKQHDIQRIADALDIGANRIERDNWVGNARRQLEEVLEQL